MSHLYRRGKEGVFWLAYYENSKLTRESLKTKDKSTARYLQNKKDRELMENKSSAPKQSRECLPLLREYSKFNQNRRSKSANLNSEEKIKSFLAYSNIQTIDQITEKRLQEYLNHRISKESLSLYTINHIIAILKAWLNYAVRMKYIFSNPLSRVKKYKLPENPKKFLSKEEIESLLKASKDSNLYIDRQATLYPIIATGIYTGMRPSEIFNLEWQDIDFAHNQVTVKNKESFIIKTKKFRVIPLHDRLRAIIKPLAKDKGPCFDCANRRRIFNRVRKKANLPNITLYTLRHTFISHAMMNGIPPATVSKWAGHSSIVTTMGYSHLCPDHSAKEIAKIDY